LRRIAPNCAELRRIARRRASFGSRNFASVKKVDRIEATSERPTVAETAPLETAPICEWPKANESAESCAQRGRVR
jgi:hypothetical protein